MKGGERDIAASGLEAALAAAPLTSMGPEWACGAGGAWPLLPLPCAPLPVPSGFSQMKTLLSDNWPSSSSPAAQGKGLFQPCSEDQPCQTHWEMSLSYKSPSQGVCKGDLDSTGFPRSRFQNRDRDMMAALGHQSIIWLIRTSARGARRGNWNSRRAAK